MVRISELRSRDVVNVMDGKRLGAIDDVELDWERARVTAIIVPGPGRFFGIFGRDKDYVIPWEKIVKIGIDVILVELEYGGSGTTRSHAERSRFPPGRIQGPPIGQLV